MLEILISMSVLLVALLGFSLSVVSSKALSNANRESTIATEAARKMIEELQEVDFDDLFILYNQDPTDDPGVQGSAPGAGFAVPVLEVRQNDPDGLAGEIFFPVDPNGDPGDLLENVDETSLGMPRDLNGDGFVDGADHSTDYLLLPVRVRVEWTGASGNGSVELKTFLTER